MALQRLKDFYQATNLNSFNEMLTQRVVVTEKIAAAAFHVRRGLESFEYYKSGNNDSMSMVDRTLTSLYETGIKHFQSLTNDVKLEMPTDWKFGFDYLPEANVSTVEYDQTPYNFMILSHIQVLNNTGKVKKVLTDPIILKEWANKLEVQAPSVVFDGILDEQQKKMLTSILSTSSEEFARRFTNESFTQYAYKMFNPAAYKSVLNEDLLKPIDGLVLSFVDSTQIKSFKLDDLKIESNIDSREGSHTYQLTMVDVLEFFSSYDISSIELTESAADKRYIQLISEMYNDYVKENAPKYVGVNFQPADFAKSSLFELNTKWIENEKTLTYVENSMLAELFKIILGSFNKRKIKESSLMNQTMIDQLNEIIDKIENRIYEKITDENMIHTFNTYMSHNKIKTTKSNLNEALKINHPEQGKEKVNIFVGRFQPFTMGHVKVLETLYKKNGFPVVVFLVKAAKVKKEDAIKRPYDTETQIEMFNRVQKEYKFLKDVIVVPSAAIDTMFNELRPGYEPVLWGTGTDRMKAYGFMVNNDKYRDELGVLPEFELHEIQRGDDDISATKVRAALESDDAKEFNKMTPSSMHPMFKELKEKLEKSLSVIESTENSEILTFEEFKQING